MFHSMIYNTPFVFPFSGKSAKNVEIVQKTFKRRRSAMKVDQEELEQRSYEET